MQRLWAAILLVALTAGMSVHAADAIDAATRERIDAIVLGLMQQQRIPGAAVLVARGGEPVYIKGYGLADVENGVPVTPQTVFQSGSVGKMFTATGVMLLAREGKLSLDDSLAKYFQDIPASWREITVRQLLQHRSGIPDYETDFDLRRDYTQEEFISEFARPPLDFAPGTQFSYSNSGYVLLGFIIEKVSGKFYGDYLAERVFGPLGMQGSRVNDIDAIVPHRAQGYLLEAGKLVNDEWVSPSLSVTADGSLLFPVEDLARWDRALYGDELLPQAALQQMFAAAPFLDGTRSIDGYGYGWRTSQVRGHRFVSHSGVWQGFATFLGRFIDDRLTIAVLTNLGSARTHTLVMSVAGAIDPALGPCEPISDTDPARTATAKRVVLSFLRGETNRELAPMLRSAQAKLDRQRLQTELGQPREDAAFHLVELPDAGTRTYLLKLDDGQALVDVREQGGRIESLRFRAP